MVERFWKKFRYNFDNMMSRGLLPLISLLAIFTLIFVLVISLVVAVFELFPLGQSLSFGEVIWASLLRTLDPGTMGNDTGIGFRAAMLLVTLFGVVLVASLIGIISNALSSRIEQLRKGKSRVIEENHTLILGWNSKVFTIVRELVIANLNHKKSVIVLMADRDKVDMEEQLRRKIGDTGKTQIVVRSGKPMSKTDLEIVAPRSSKAIVILAPDFSDDADSFSIKTCLALKGVGATDSKSRIIVGEIQDWNNLEAAELVSEGSVHWVLGHDLVSRIIVQTCRQGGLSAVFTDLLDFAGSELHLLDNPDIVGKTYRDVSLQLEESVLAGYTSNHRVVLNPNPSYVFTAEDKGIVLAEDDEKLGLTSIAAIQENYTSDVADNQVPLESTLILGANEAMALLLQELDLDSVTGSKVVLINPEVDLREVTFNNIELELIMADPTKRQVLEDIQINRFNHVIIVANRESMGTQEADARTLLTLLHVRALTKENPSINIVSEVRDDHNRELAESGRADDFIVSDKIVSHVIAQLSQNKHLGPVLNSLFSGAGSRITISPITNYVKTGVPVTFDTLVESALRRGESAIGYRLHSLRSEPGEMHGVRLNPNRKAQVHFSESDALVVLSHR